jgi:DNA-binding XRE family transcriptional regulator
MKKQTKRKSPLKQYRERLEPRPTQEEIAREVEMSLRGYQDIEAGKAIPGLDRALRICSALKITFADLCDALGLDISGLPEETFSPIKKEV